MGVVYISPRFGGAIAWIDERSEGVTIIADTKRREGDDGCGGGVAKKKKKDQENEWAGPSWGTRLQMSPTGKNH